MTNAESQQPELVAADPATPSSILAKLAEEGDTTIRRIVTINPNTPLSTLYKLGLDFPIEFLDNPLFPLLQLTDPQLLADNEALIYALLRCGHLPEHWLLWFQQHHTFQHIPDLPLHITLSGETAHPWGEPEDTDDYTLLTLAQLSQYYHSSPDLLSYLANSTDHTIQEEVAHHPHTPPDILHTLSTSSSEWVRRAVASNPQTSENTLSLLTQDPRNGVHLDLTSNPHVPAAILSTLSRKIDTTTLQAVASHPHTPPDVLWQLASHQETSIRAAVANNPAIPTDLLCFLANSTDIDIQAIVAKNPRMPLNFLQVPAQASSTIHSIVRAAVAENPSLPTDMLYNLANDHDILVRESLAKNPKTPHDIFLRLLADTGITQSIVDLYMVENPNTPPHILKSLLNHPDVTIRRKLAWHLKLHPHAQQFLLRDSDDEVRNVAREIYPLAQEFQASLYSPYTSQQSLDSLIQLVQQLQLSFFKRHTHFGTSPYQLTEELAMLLTSSHLPSHFLTPLIGSVLSLWFRYRHNTKLWHKDNLYHRKNILKVSIHLLSCPYIPTGSLDSFAVSELWEERYLVALHTQTYIQTRQQLALDGNRYVRAAARLSLENQ